MSDPEYVYCWRYEVAPGNRAAFELLYGADGAWVRLFKGSADWINTELLRDLDRPGVYFTIDRWRSRARYEAYRASVRESWDAIDRQAEQLTLSEDQVGRLEPLGTGSTRGAGRQP